jgi:hypothetical protein
VSFKIGGLVVAPAGPLEHVRLSGASAPKPSCVGDDDRPGWALGRGSIWHPWLVNSVGVRESGAEGVPSVAAIVCRPASAIADAVIKDRTDEVENTGHVTSLTARVGRRSRKVLKMPPKIC